MRKYFSSLFMFFASSCSLMFATPAGVLDTTFNNSGIQPGTVTTTVDNVPAFGRGVAIQTNGKIVVVGTTGALPLLFAVARFNSDGTLDTTFNALGVQPGTTTLAVNNNLQSIGNDVAIQPDGKIIVVGATRTDGSNEFAAVVRYNSDGTLDTTFNALGTQPGTVAIKVNDAFVVSNTSVALQNDGKIVISAASRNNFFAAARFNSDGTLDTTFNALGVQPGTVGTPIGDTIESVSYDLAIQPDNKIVLVGFADNEIFAAARFNTDGTLDTTFNSGGTIPGTVTTTIANLDTSFGYAVAIQTDGKIVLAGESTVLAGNFADLARFNSDGTLDTTFNASGVQPGTLALATMDNLINAFAYHLVLQPNGQIIIAGGVYDAALFGLARFNTNGTLDTTFNPNGVQPGTVTTTVDNTSGEQIWETALQADGKIVAAGPITGPSRFAVARFLAEGTIVNVCD